MHPSAPAAGAAARRVTWRDVFGVAEFRGLFAAQLGSNLGDQLAKIALAILVFQRTQSAFLSALTYAVTFLPGIVAGPLLGWLADRRPRREVMVGCDLARAVLVAPMLLPGLPTGALVGLLFAVSFFDAPFSAARSALLTEVLEGERYAVGQSIGQAMFQVSQVVGFGMGGALVAVLRPRGALAIDIATFLLSAALVRLCSPGRPARDTAAVASRWSLVTDGAVEVARRPELRRLLGITAVFFGLIIATEGLSVSYAAELGHGAVATGLLTAAVPVGSALGLVLVVRLPEARQMAGLRLLSALWALPLVATALRPPVWVACLLWATAGALGGFQVLGNVLFVRYLRTANRGRVFAFAQSALVAVQGAGLVVFGLVARLTSPSAAVAYAGLAGVVGCGLLSLQLGRPPFGPTPPGSSSTHTGRYASVGSDRTDAAAVSAGRPAGPASLLPRWRVSAVYAISVAVIAAVVSTLLLVHLDRPVVSTIHLPWWVLALLYLGTSLTPLHFQLKADAHSVIVNQVPFLLGLFFAGPVALLVGLLLGPTVRELRTRSLMKFLANRAESCVEVIIATFLFHLLAAHTTVDGRQLAAGALAVIAADVFGFSFLSGVRRLVARELRLRDLRIPLLFTALVTATASSVGLLAVVALAANTAAGIILGIVGLLLVVGFRAFASLQQRHAGLGRLYALQEHMGALVPRGESLFPVLRQTKALLLAADVVVEIPEGAGIRVIRVDAADLCSERVLPQPDGDPSRWAPPAGLSVALRDGERQLGMLRVGQRLGTVRGFVESDLRLLATLAAHVGDALQRGTLIESLHEAATHDPLTGLLTLAELMRLLDERLLREERHLVALLNVSRLQDVNDSLGHQAGDALLVEVAARLTRVLPAGALVARSGGGEFAVSIGGLDASAAAGVVEVMSGAVSGLVQVLDVTVDLRSRVGWLLAPADGVDAAALLRRADLALGSAKRGFQATGRYVAALDVDGGRRLRLVNDLRDALAAGDLQVVYQPLVTPMDGRVVAAEALSRWTHPSLGVVSPDEFITVAEQSGLISDLTDYVLDRALAQVRRWVDAGRDLHVAVNLSARCLTDIALPGRVLDALARHRLPPARLTLEVTETSVADDPARALAVLQRLRGMGVRLSIDDFGTGYSSLASLKNFPVQEVKLDRSFLVDLDVESDQEAAADLALLGAVVALGHSMHLEIVAEGVETPQAYRRLTALGVDVLQGYYLGRPGPGEQLPADAPPATGFRALRSVGTAEARGR